MIPLQLRLTNFMSYGENVSPLDFTGLKFACLSGDNGNGKSALLDAMTWALFGKTRAKSEDDIVRRGKTDAQVVFDFQVEETHYRIDRRRSKRGSTWELQALQDDGNFRSLTGVSTRETEAKIRGLLRMDYDMFLASGYVAQGRADEFTRIGPTKRKEILADILNIGHYEKLEKYARERHDDAEHAEKDAEREIASLDAHLQRRPEVDANLQAAETRRDQLLAETERWQSELERLQQQVLFMEAEERRAVELKARVVEQMRENQEDERTLEEIRHRITDAENAVLHKDELVREYARYNYLQEQLQRLEEKNREYHRTYRRMKELEQSIADADRKLDRDRYIVFCEVEQIEQATRDIAQFEAEVAELDRQILAYGDLNARIADADQQWQEATEAFNTLKEENAALKAGGGPLQERLEALKSSDAAICLYCGLPLPPEKRRGAIAETEQALADLTQRLNEMKAQGSRLKIEVERWRKEVTRLQDERLYCSRLETRRGQALQQQNQLMERARELPALRRRLLELERQLHDKDFSHVEQEELVTLSARLELLERAMSERETVQQELTTISDIERRMLAVERAEQLLREMPADRDRLQRRITNRLRQIEEDRRRLQEHFQHVEGIGEVRRQRDEVAGYLRGVHGDRQQVEREIGQYRGELLRYDQMGEQRRKREEERKQAARERDQFKELMGAFGKKGIQALIIEQALPEIQDDANQILAQMTSNAMRIELRSTREGKARATGTIETLEIVISDDVGERPYELYSGGEAFRVNFALRIALAKMLARRAGAPLQTLILDEGFGTQDPRGREAIIDALNAVAEQFALILVITHIEELKDVFPARIEVVKGVDGSTFRIV